MFRKAAIGAAAAGVLTACVAIPTMAQPQTYTSSDGVLSIELPDESWKEMTDPANWIVLSDGSNTVTIQHFANGEKLPDRQIADNHYVNVLEAMFSSKNEVFLITGALTDTSKCAEIATMMSSARVLPRQPYRRKPHLPASLRSYLQMRRCIPQHRVCM